MLSHSIGELGRPREVSCLKLLRTLECVGESTCLIDHCLSCCQTKSAGQEGLNFIFMDVTYAHLVHVRPLEHSPHEAFLLPWNNMQLRD